MDQWLPNSETKPAHQKKTIAPDQTFGLGIRFVGLVHGALKVTLETQAQGASAASHVIQACSGWRPAAEPCILPGGFHLLEQLIHLQRGIQIQLRKGHLLHDPLLGIQSLQFETSPVFFSDQIR